MAHTVFDSESLARQKQGEIREERAANELATYLAKMCQAHVVLINQWNDFEHQQGHRLLAQVFEQKVKKLNPNITFFTRPLTDNQARFCGLAPGSSMKSMDLLLPNGTSKPIAGYQNHPILPEYTILLQREVKIPNPLVNHAKGKDFPKAKKITKPDGTTEWTYDDLTPFESKGYEAAGTLVGWRTLLARLVLERISTPEAIEREFGASDRETWAVRMGRRDPNALTAI